MTLGDTLHRYPPITPSLGSSVLTAGHVAGPLSHCRGSHLAPFRTQGAPRELPGAPVELPESSTVELHVFLDRSVVETYTGGAVATSRCMLPAGVGGDDAKGVVRSYTTPLVLLEPLFRCLWSLPKS